MTKQINIGGVPVGGGAPVAIQSMCNTRTDDVEATVGQILRLEAAGCEIVRVAVPDRAAAHAIGAIKERIHIPLVVDIHFDYKLALECIAAGADKVRINPGNIGGRLPPEGDPHPHRRQRRQSGTGAAGEVRSRLPRGPGGVRLWTHPPAEPI